MKLTVKLCFVLFLCLPLNAFAQLPAQMISDFAPHGGYVIMPIGDEFLIDLDAAVNLQEGDILTLVMPGEKVIHPISKEILGTLDVPKGYLQVTRIKSGYSYARLLSSETAPQKGGQVRRFEQVPTRYNGDATEASNKLYQQLQEGLPHLNWLDSSSTTQPILSFNLTGSTLEVAGATGNTLKTYRFVDETLVAPAKVPSAPSAFKVDEDPSKNRSLLNKTVNNLLDSVGLGKSGGSSMSPAGIIRSNTGNDAVWFGPNMAGSPVGITVADLDGDNRLETAVAMEDQVLIGRIEQGEFTQTASIDISSGIKLLSLDHFDLDNNGLPELYLTAEKNMGLASLVIEYSSGNYITVIDGISWFLRASDLPGRGRTLLGQSLARGEDPFEGKPFVVIRQGNSLEKGDEINLPDSVNLFSFIPLSQDGEGPLYAYLTPGDYLKVVSAQGIERWESGGYFGGTETRFYTQKVQGNELVPPVYIPPRILQLPSGDILVSQNDGLRTMQRFRMFKASRLLALRWNGFAMDEQWRTSEQNGYLADFALADADNDGQSELVLAMKFKHKGLIDKARSTIIVYELQ